MRHIQAIEDAAKTGMSPTASRKLSKSLAQLKHEVSSPAPRPQIIDKILSGISIIKGSAEFVAAVVAIIEFFSKLPLPN